MQRVRIGITGLAVVFLIVLLAATIVGFHSKDTTSNDAADPTTNAASRITGAGLPLPKS